MPNRHIQATSMATARATRLALRCVCRLWLASEPTKASACRERQLVWALSVCACVRARLWWEGVNKGGALCISFKSNEKGEEKKTKNKTKKKPKSENRNHIFLLIDSPKHNGKTFSWRRMAMWEGPALGPRQGFGHPLISQNGERIQAAFLCFSRQCGWKPCCKVPPS